MIGCGLALKTAHMTDAEFWSYVFPDAPDQWEHDVEDVMTLSTRDCVRCGLPIKVDDWEEAMQRQDESFCPECSSEHLDYEEPIA